MIIIVLAAVVTAAILFSQSHAPLFSNPSGTMNSVIWEKISSDSLWKLTENSIELSDEDFDVFYDAVIKVVKRHGTFSDGGLEAADFSSSRYVDQCTCMGVVARSKTVDDALAMDVAQALKQFEGTHYVIFDGDHGVCCITSDGKFFKIVD